MLKLNNLLAISLFVLLSSPFLTIFAHANPSPAMYVSPASKNVNIGETFIVGVDVSDVVGMTCWQFTLLFDTSKLQCTNATEGPFLKSGGNTYSTKTINNTSGSVLFGCTLTGMSVQVNGSGVLATVTFNVNAAGQSTLHLGDTLLGDTNLPPKDIPHTTGDGIIYVGSSSNTAPMASNLTIIPSSPNTTDNLVGDYAYYDADGNPESGSEIRWYKNGTVQSAYNDQLTIPSSATAKGQVWYFTVRPKDGRDFGDLKTSPSVTVLNSPPVDSGLTITPSSPKTTDSLVGSYTYYDADGDAENGSEIRWYRDGVSQSAYNDRLLVPSNTTANGQVWYFTVKPKDGEAFGSLKQSPSVTVGRVNNAPVASNLTVTPSAPLLSDNLTARYDYYDVDGDPESGTEISWYKNGVLQPAFNNTLVVPSSATSQGETWYFTVRPKDGKDFGVLQTSPSVTIVAHHDVAVMSIVPSKTVVGQGCPLFVNVTVANNGGFNETFDVAAYTSARVIGTSTVTLPGYSVTSVTFTWNTTGSDLGEYTMSAVASAVPGETNVTDNTYVYGIITVGILGDLNCDGKVNIIDLVLAAKGFNCKSGDTRWNPNADVNNDGRVNIVDISLLAKWYWNFQVDQLKPKTGISIQPSSVQKTSGDVGTYFNVTVTIENVTDLFGFDFNVTWDNSLITLNTCFFREALNGVWGEGNWFVARNLNGSGWCQLAALSTKAGFNTTSSQTLLILEFQVENPAASTTRETPIHFESHKLSDSKYTPVSHVVQDGVYRALG